MLVVSLYKNSFSQMSNNKKHLQNFTASETLPIAKDSFTKTKPLPAKIEVETAPTYSQDAVISQSLNYLKNLDFDKNDIAYLQKQGVILPFLSSNEALNFIKKSNVTIKFDALPSPKIHAQYDYENNFIKINEIYKNTKNPAEILAIAEAILHEAGHAVDGDGASSIQEEIDCLALNAVSHRALSKKYPNAFLNSDSLIVKDGVSVYADLFFNNDETKNKLVTRISQKYGLLPAGDFKHPPKDLAFRVKNATIATQLPK